MKKENLSRIIVAGLMATSVSVYANVSYAAPDWSWNPGGDSDTEVVRDVDYQEGTITTEDETKLNDPNLSHKEDDKPFHGQGGGGVLGDENCGEKISDTDLTVGDVNKVVDDLVENDANIDKKVEAVKDDVAGIKEKIESGELKGEKGDQGEQGIQGEKGEKGDSILSGDYTVKNEKVEMPIVNEKGEIVGFVTIDNMAGADQLEVEEETREKEDNKLQDNIDQEVANRTEADDKLQDNIDQEVANRTEADDKLQDNIDQEVANRTEADNKLQDNIDRVEQNA